MRYALPIVFVLGLALLVTLPRTSSRNGCVPGPGG